MHLSKLPAAIAKRVTEHARKITTAELNRWIQTVQKRRAVPSTRAGRVPRLYYVTQTGTCPPELTLFVNAPHRLSESYRRYLWLDFTATFGFHGTPVRLKVRKSD
jgi:GTP-binding protein